MVEIPDLRDANNPIQILLIEDCEGDAVLIKLAAAQFASPVTITVSIERIADQMRIGVGTVVRVLQTDSPVRTA